MRSYIRIYTIKTLCVILLLGFIPVLINPEIISTIYSVIGIMFSIALSLIVTFNLQGIKSMSSIKSIRYKLKSLRKKHIVNFSIDTLLYILSTMIDKKGVNLISFSLNSLDIKMNIQLIIVGLLISSIFYYILNFIDVQKLNDQIFNELNNIESGDKSVS